MLATPTFYIQAIVSSHRLCHCEVLCDIQQLVADSVCYLVINGRY